MKFIETGMRGVIAALVLAAPLAAQQETTAPPATLSLDEAITLARQNNPLYRQTQNDESVADWQSREAYANFLPSITASNSFGYTASGVQRIGNLSAAEFGLGRTPVYYSSSYGLNLNMQLSGSTFFQAAQQKANASAVEAQTEAAGYTLQMSVTQAYLAALGARDAVNVARSAVESAEQARQIAEARATVGAATRLDVSQAEVDYGRAEVLLIQAENLYDTERLRLLQTIGVEIPRELELTTEFAVFEPMWEVPDLTETALRAHPQVLAAQRSEAAANAAARAAWSTYLPSLSLFGQWSGYVQKAADTDFLIASSQNTAQNQVNNCQRNNFISAGLSMPFPDYPIDCNAEFAFTPADEASIRQANSRYPFDYTPSPAYFQLRVDVPIFDGFTRERQLQTARAAAEDAKYQTRAEELARRTDVSTALLNLRTAYRTVQIEERNAQTAGEQLEIARERYRLGAGCGPVSGGAGQQNGGLCTTFLELTQAQEQKVRADLAHIAAIYTFHDNLARLESAVGRPLR